MKNNKSTASLNLSNTLNIRQVTSPTHKKVEGFDNVGLSSTFTSKIDKLKSKPKTEALEDQYIKGLQDEIKYLEMELKLLQEKDIEKHGQIDQLEKVNKILFSSLEMEYPSMRIFLPSKMDSITINQAMRKKSKNFQTKNRKELYSLRDSLIR